MLKKIRLSIVFDVRPDQEVGTKNAIEEWLKQSFNVNRIAIHRKEIIVNDGGEKT